MTAQKEKEKAAFEAFLRANRSLAAQIGNNWRVQEEEGAFPDILATSKGGQVLGFELGEWLHEDKIRQSMKTDQFASDLKHAIGQQPENQPQYIHCVLLTPRNDRTRFDQRHGEKFRAELFQLVEETDQQWPNQRFWQDLPGYHCKEFERFPLLSKYLDEVWFVPRVTGGERKKPHPPGIPWIEIEGRGGAYSGGSAREALQEIISKKASHYGSSSGQRVSLLIHYGADAFVYNTPFMDIMTPDLEAVAKVASEVVQFFLRERPLPFERVYLCNTLPSELEAYEIFPILMRAT